MNTVSLIHLDTSQTIRVLVWSLKTMDHHRVLDRVLCLACLIVVTFFKIRVPHNRSVIITSTDNSRVFPTNATVPFDCVIIVFWWIVYTNIKHDVFMLVMSAQNF